MHTIFQLYIKTMYTETLKKANELDLDSLLFTALREEYLKRVEINGSHFSNPTELIKTVIVNIIFLKLAPFVLC